jgi:hypothetical protein
LLYGDDHINSSFMFIIETLKEVTGHCFLFVCDKRLFSTCDLSGAVNEFFGERVMAESRNRP